MARGGIHIATVYGPDGQVVQREHKGQAVGPLVVERESAWRAWLSARNYEFPPGTAVKVVYRPKPVPGTSLQAPDVPVWHRVFDGKQWTEAETGEVVA